MLRKYLFTAIVLLAVLACTEQLYMPLTTDAYEGTSYEKLVQGRKLYINHCGSCHSLHLPEERTDTAWARILNNMQVRAKIDDPTKEVIYRYLTLKSK